MTRTKTPSPAACLHEQTVRHHCRALKMPTVAGQFETLAQAAIREGHGHVQYLDALLTAEIEERERKGVVRRIQEARLPRVKTLAERRVRFTSAAALVNELVEARAASQLSRALGRWERVDLICIDEVGYVPLMEMGAELMFQVIADRAEKTALIVTTNLPFSEWGQVFPNPRLCGAVLDRVTDQAHIIETGGESYRFKRSLAKRGATAS